MSKLQLTFSGKRSAKKEGLYISCNVHNGNTNVYPDVVKELGLKKGDRINFSELGGNLYMTQETEGFTLSEKFQCTSGNVASTFKSAYKEKAGDNEVIIASIDISPIEAEVEIDGEMKDITVYALSYSSSQPQKGSGPKAKSNDSDDKVEEEVEEELV